MEEDWSKLLKRRFKPAEAAAITGVSPELQRKWIERYFSKQDNSLGEYHWRLEAEGSHSRYTWAGVQALGLFSELVSDVGADAARMALERTSKGGLLHDFQVDWRDRPTGDIHLFYPFDGNERKVTTTTLANLPKGDCAPTRFYLYNFSAFQRRLIDSAVSALEVGLAAEPGELSA